MAAEAALLDGLTKKLESALSKDRIEYWTNLAGGDADRGLALHQRNTVIAAALFGDLQALEIALRNAVDRELIHSIGTTWLSDSRFDTADAWEAARRSTRRRGIAMTTRDKVIVNLQFKFWIDVLEKKDVRLNTNAIFRYGNFPKREIISDLRSLVRLRNDAMHHEPVIDRDGKRRPERLAEDMERLYRLLKAISPPAEEWARINSLVLPFLAAGIAGCDDVDGAEVTISVP